MTKAEYYLGLHGYCLPSSSNGKCAWGDNKCSECGYKDWYEHHFNFEEMQ